MQRYAKMETSTTEVTCPATRKPQTLHEAYLHNATGILQPDKIWNGEMHWLMYGIDFGQIVKKGRMPGIEDALETCVAKQQECRLLASRKVQERGAEIHFQKLTNAGDNSNQICKYIYHFFIAFQLINSIQLLTQNRVTACITVETFDIKATRVIINSINIKVQDKKNKPHTKKYINRNRNVRTYIHACTLFCFTQVFNKQKTSYFTTFNPNPRLFAVQKSFITRKPTTWR